MNTNDGKYFDFTTSVGGGGGDSFAPLVSIIESNTGTQTNVRVGYTQVTWSNGLPSLIEKYKDHTKVQKLYTITPTFTNGLPTQVVIVNEDDAITETLTINFVDGLPTEVTKT